MPVSLPPHNILSPFHLDTLTASVVRGDLLIGNSTPKWSRLAIGNGVLIGGTDPAWSMTPSLTTLALTSTLTSTQSIAAVSTDGVILTNTTAAAAGAQQQSPRLRLTGQGWKTTATAASQTVDWIIENQPVQGAANPTSILVFSSQVNGAGYAAKLSLGSDGSLNGLGAGQPTLTWGGGISVGAGQFVLFSGGTQIRNESTNVVTFRNGTTAQEVQVYGTFTSSTVFERLSFKAVAASSFVIEAQFGGGGGTARGIALVTNTTTGLVVQAFTTTVNPWVLVCGADMATGTRFLVNAGQKWTGTSGTANDFAISTVVNPATTSTLAYACMKVLATMNYAGTPAGAGSYTVLDAVITETLSPTGTSYFLRFRNGAAGTTDTFWVDSTGLIASASTTLHRSLAALTNGAAAALGTLTNAPAAGNPTKWVPINDNGTTRYIPAW